MLSRLPKGDVTVTRKLQHDERLQLSAAIHVTVVEPMGKNDPDAGEHVTSGVEHPPVATGEEKLTTAPAPAPCIVELGTVTSAGHVMSIGGPMEQAFGGYTAIERLPPVSG